MCVKVNAKNSRLRIRLKRIAFSSDLKVFNDLHVLMFSGREFHRVGAIHVYENALSP